MGYRAASELNWSGDLPRNQNCTECGRDALADAVTEAAAQSSGSRGKATCVSLLEEREEGPTRRAGPGHSHLGSRL